MFDCSSLDWLVSQNESLAINDIATNCSKTWTMNYKGTS